MGNELKTAFEGMMTEFAGDTKRRLGGIENKLDEHGERLAKIETKIEQNGNGNGKKPWPRPITLSLGAGGAAALGAAVVKIIEILSKHA